MGFFKGLLCLLLHPLRFLLFGVGFLLYMPGAIGTAISIFVFVVKLIQGADLNAYFQEYGIFMAVLLGLFVVGMMMAFLAAMLSNLVEDLEYGGHTESSSTSKSSSYSGGSGRSGSSGYSGSTSYSGSSGYSGGSFDAGSYVRSQCSSHIYGVTSSEDISRIQNDTSLTPQQQQQALDEYNRLSGLYY